MRLAPAPNRSSAPFLSVLFSRRFRFLPLVCVGVVFACLVTLYSRSFTSGQHWEFTLPATTSSPDGGLPPPLPSTDPSPHPHDHVHPPSPVVSSDGSSPLPLTAAPVHDAAHPHPAKPRSEPEEGDGANARIPLAEDETERLTELFALHAQHNHSDHAPEPEVLTEAQQARVQRLQWEEGNATQSCREVQAQHSVVPGSSWGSLSDDEKRWWKLSNCDALLVIKDYRSWLQQHPELYAPVQVPPDRPSPGNRSGTDDVIAICISTTSRHLKVEDIEDMTLFKSLLPSIGDTVEAGYEYWIYLLYDEGDPFLDRDDTRAAVQRWFDGHLIAPLAAQGIRLRHVPVRYRNHLKKPGPAFNFMTHLAFIDGVDWLYRINDDTYFMSPFASSFVKALQALGPPYGVIGPLCREGATAILTHDFVHRTHHLMMPHHYPPPLSDWWMDDWISKVYGRQRTRRSYDVIVKHLVKVSGTKYNIDGKHALLLPTEVEAGRRHIERYLEREGLTQELEAYQKDEFNFTP